MSDTHHSRCFCSDKDLEGAICKLFHSQFVSKAIPPCCIHCNLSALWGVNGKQILKRLQYQTSGFNAVGKDDASLESMLCISLISNIAKLIKVRQATLNGAYFHINVWLIIPQVNLNCTIKVES